MSAPKSTILAVDDAEEVRRLVEAALGKLHVVKAAPDARTALRLALEAPRPDLVLLDADLGGASGYEVCKAMKATPALAELPVIFMSEVAKASDIAQGFRYGAIDCLTKPLAPAAVLSRVETHLEQIARERSVRLDHSHEQLVGRLTRALELHIGWPSGNRAVRLAHYARALAQAAGARDVACDLIMKAAPLFDIGKLGVPAELLRKEALLQGAERAQFERHPAIGAEIIGESDDPLLKLARTVALSQRERWDGSGYPGHLKGNDIPWGGRVMAIVAAFEALTSPPYHRAPLPLERAAAEIAAEAGKQFDPALVQALQKALPAFRRVYETYSDKQVAEADDEVIGGPAPKRQESEADRTLIAPLALRGTPVSDEARARMAGERAAAEDKAAQAARERRDLEQAAALAAEQRALAEEKLAKAAEERRRADEAAAQAAEKRVGAEARAGGADPQTAIALSRAQEMLAQLQKERGTLQAELERLQAALAEKEKARAAAPAADLQKAETALANLRKEHGAVQAELQRAKAALAEKEKQRAPAQPLSLEPDDIVIGTSSPSKALVADDDDLVIGSPSAQKPPALAAVPDQSLQRERAAAIAERDKALAEIERLQAALAEKEKERAHSQALMLVEDEKRSIPSDKANVETLAELERTRAALAEREKEHAAAVAERDQVLAEIKSLQAALAEKEKEQARPQALSLADDDVVIGSPSSEKPNEETLAELARAQAALAEQAKEREAAEALRDEAIAELQRVEAALAEAQEQRERSEAAAAQATTELARANEALARKPKEPPKPAAVGDDAGRAMLAQAQKERAAAEQRLAQVEKERRRTEELARVQQELTRGNEEAGRRIAEQVAQVRAERQRNEELLAQMKGSERAGGQSFAESEAAEARAEEAARRRREEDQAAARAAEERRLAEEALTASIAEREAAAAAAAERRRAAVREAAAQSLARPAPRGGRIAMGFVIGVLAAAATGAVLWFSGVLEPAPQAAPAAEVVAAPNAESPLSKGEPLPLRREEQIPDTPAGR